MLNEQSGHEQLGRTRDKVERGHVEGGGDEVESGRGAKVREGVRFKSSAIAAREEVCCCGAAIAGN